MSDTGDEAGAILGVFAVILGLAIFGFIASSVQGNKDREACKAHGGVYHPIYKSDDLCLKNADVIPMRELAGAKETEENKPRVVRYKPRFQ